MNGGSAARPRVLAILARFLVLGALLFATVSALRDDDTSAGGAPPRASVDPEQLLADEAIRLGLHRTDSLVRRRLVRDVAFLEDSDPRARDAAAPFSDPTETAQVERAIALGLHEQDPVVRRRLAQKLDLLLAERVRRDAPSREELDAALHETPGRHRLAARIELAHVYLGADVETTEAEGLLREMNARPIHPPDHVDLGERFLAGTRTRAFDARALGETFGPGFAADLEGLPLRRWAGPIRSSYGWHLVWIEARRQPAWPAPEQVDKQLAERVYEARFQRVRAEVLTSLRSRRATEQAG